MIQALASRYQRRTALILFVLFYLQIVLPNLAKAISANKVEPFQLHWDGHVRAPIAERFKSIQQKYGGISQEINRPSKSQKITIGGPGQPEMSSFKSVNSNDMVDLFSGDFSYNIPLMDVGGYPVNIHYSSNVSMDQEASWVGLGWNVNPGTVNRTMRGLPDDFDGSDSISKTQNVKDNRTVGVKIHPDLEIVGLPKGLTATVGIFHNTYNGWGVETGINSTIGAGIGSKGSLSASLAISNNSQTGLNVSPSMGVKLSNYDQEGNGRTVSLGLSTNYNSRAGISGLELNTEVRAVKSMNDLSREELNGGLAVNYPSAGISFATPSYTPSITMPFTSTQFSFKAKVGSERWVLHSSLIPIEGYVSVQKIEIADRTQKLPAAGYLYLTNTNDRPNTLQDFNREKDLPFNEKTTPHIAIPQYSYDIYSISGEGTGGMFRPYRGDVGFVRDYTVRTKSKSDRFSLDLGFGSYFHGGVDFSFTNSFTENNEWKSQNDLNKYIGFRQSDSNFQAVYFRNPGEKTTNAQAYYESVGNDALLRVKLTGDKEDIKATNSLLQFKNGKQTGEIPITSSLAKKERDKRSQVISYLTAADASEYGLDKDIISYKENTIPIDGCSDSTTVIKRIDGKIRKKHHLSQITVLNGDGRRYVYGLPAYNVEQKDVTFSVDKEEDLTNLSKGIVSYTKGTDNSTSNTKGKDGLFTSDSMPAYAHSFLLTGIVSPDYVDVKGDGITQDDIGDAVKFNYTRLYGDDNGLFLWRTPNDSAKANYNEGLKSYKRDDKGTYMYGKKEVWYLNSIESKTMIAVFKTDSNRQDIYSVRDENGGLDKTKPLRKLRQIELYAKSDLVKNPTNARPVKTVHFAYSYSLCKGIAGDSSTGKLTLDSIWFSYNGNEKGKLNPYVFRYHQGQSVYNPGYNSKHYDRWGNYKDPSTNPGGLNNNDYPYAEQEKTKADQNAAAWTMDEIRLPSGGKIKVQYESDDYAYVQNKRATQFFKLAAISSSAFDTLGTALYSSGADKNFVFIKSSVPLTGRKDIIEKYLEGNKFIYFKLAVNVPTDRWGGGYELVPVYAEVEDFDIVNSQKFWLKLKNVEGEGALARSAIQFLRLNLPSKAYTISEPGDNISVLDAVKMAVSSFKEIKTAVSGFGKDARNRGLCKTVDTSKSFIRLNNPDFKKLGGGLRVKRIEVWDNWNVMTGQRESVYGQEYSYSKNEIINGRQLTISSGVASYEPLIGAEENPFRQPIPYGEKMAPLAPANNLFSEEPLGESYFPSASVGYSKVRVRTINAKAKSANGWAETEYFTSKDFPVIAENTILDPSSRKRYNPALQNFLKINAVHNISISQGFKIELNDMNGRIKSQYSFAETDSIHPISYVRNFYKVDNDTAYQKHLNNEVWIVDSLNGHIKKNGIVGLDIEIIQDMREQTSQTLSDNKSVNIDVVPGFIFPFVLPSFFPLPQKEQTRFRSAATVKIVQRYGILDSVAAMDKGSIVSTKNLLYDGETGEVVLSRTNNEFNDPVFNFSYPAHWIYSGMGMAYKNIDAVFTNLKLIKGKLYYGDDSAEPFPVKRFFESGDELKLRGNYRTLQTGENCVLFTVPSPGTTPNYSSFPNKAWVIEASKAKEGDSSLFFIDEKGNQLTGEVDTIRVLRSGKRNMLDASVGSIVSMANPIREITTGNYRLVLDSNTRIINTSAVTYKDLWKVENQQYAKDTIYRVYRNFPQLAVSPTVLTKRLRQDGSGGGTDSYIANSNNVATSYNRTSSNFSCSSASLYTKSILYFNLSSIPSDAIVTSANVAFTPRVPGTDLWWKMSTGGRFCSSRSSYDWSQATSYYTGTTLSYLRRITKAWNYTDPYFSFQVSQTNRVSLTESSVNTAVNCTNLVQDLVSNPNYGLMFDISRRSTTNSSEINYLNFSNVFENCSQTHGTYVCERTPPILYVNYKAYVDSVATICKTFINDTINPYRWGLLGNWRVDRAYTFYHDRKETDASFASTNIRKDGELKNFSPFWQFTDDALVQIADTSKWVWNSASSLYNKKGFEIENYDPLGRYNAGLYGYDQTLPVAVAQNSRYREILYEGFEDYEYKTKQCASCPNPKEIDFIKNYSGVALNTKERHTGKYSMKLNASSEAYFQAPLVAADTSIALSLQVDTSVIYNFTVVGTGTGLTATYSGYSNATSCPVVTGAPYTYSNTLTQGPIDFTWNNTSPNPAMCKDWYDISWDGKLQAPATDNYRFHVISDAAVAVYVNGLVAVVGGSPNVPAVGEWFNLDGGTLYTIAVQYEHFKASNAHVQLSWERQNSTTGVEVIPSRFLYRHDASTADTLGSIVPNVQRYCITPHSVTGTQMIKPSFAPVKSSKIVLSAWVKMDGNDCNTAPALDNVLVLTQYNSSGGSTNTSFVRTGVRIEGWQRYEAVVTLESTRTSMRIRAVAPSDRAIYVDDIRVQPFNSAMKSYAYDPVSLRLMAELDENNYAAYYEYDDDGTLIRVKKETERGVMTVKESRSALRKEN
jgi:hypothetical protein